MVTASRCNNAVMHDDRCRGCRPTGYGYASDFPKAARSELCPVAGLPKPFAALSIRHTLSANIDTKPTYKHAGLLQRILE